MAGDDDEQEQDGEDGATVADMLEVETLMGWDGERCQCPHGCERFADGSDDGWCEQCGKGDH